MLLLTSVTLGIITGMDIRDVADAVQTGVGNTLGNVDWSFSEESRWNDGLISLENQSLRLMVSFFTLGCARGFNKGEQNQFISAASIILIIGAGGAFKNVLSCLLIISAVLAL
ncbi:hypothetical protein QUF85_28440 [Peribacillus frigoritolerans]|uniref:Uncharacterized protein n=1 Tax=Peribacillus frigoritolerans TaxID=450367 RepID=A0AAJ1QTQ9_9BACI|nr:hypothetical protein [Peribacillus frigoritolerans]MDM5287196.1 hypothetical protein [Peribacillus frigoritolerans]